MHFLQSDKQSKISDLLTRRCLIGTGIVSGLELALDPTHRICVTPGKGITSDGKYVELSATKLFAFYRDFIPNNDYPFFYKENGSPIPLWELITEEDFQDDDQPLSPQYNQERLNPFLKDKVVFLYLDKNEIDTPEDEPDDSPVEEKNPDKSDKNKNSPSQTESGEDKKQIQEKAQDQGAVHQSPYHLRFLLMRRDDLLQQWDIRRLTSQIVWERLEDDEDYIYSDAYNPEDDKPRPRDVNLALNPALRLPEIPLRRFGFSKGDPYDCPPEGVDQSVFPKLISLDDIYDGYRPAIDEAIEDLDTALRRLYRYFKSILAKYPVWDIPNTFDALCNKWEAFKRKNQYKDAKLHKKEYIQYFYDWMRDLLAAYHELRNMLIDFTFISLADANEFPRHLLLGEPLREDAANIPRPYRQHFKQPPVYNGQADRLQAIRLYFWRILVMIKNFYLPGYIDLPEQKHCNTPIEDPEEDLKFKELKITPSKYYDQLPGLQSMPYYYYPIARHRFSLHHFWNYERTRNSSNDQILSFHANDTEDSYTDQLHVIRPLHYNIDAYPFFRIEGHICQPLLDYTEEDEVVMGVLSHLHYIKRKYNLDFGIIALPISIANPLSHTYQERMPPPDTFESFHPQHLGMEHLAGVQKGGTFAVIYDEEGMVISDFSLPYRCCHYCISGRITDCLMGTPLAGVNIVIENTDNPAQQYTETTNEEGRFSICLKIGTYRMAATLDDRFEPYQQEIPLDGDIILGIKMKNKTSILQGTLKVEPPLTPDEIQGAKITISAQPDQEHHLRDGLKFNFTNLPIGTVTLTLNIPTAGQFFTFTSDEIEIVPCEVTTYEWVVQRDNVVRRPVPQPAPPRPENISPALLEVVGRAPEGRKDKLSTISGIGPKTEEVFIKNGIVSFAQLSKMKIDTYAFLDPPLPVPPKAEWAKEATKLAKE